MRIPKETIEAVRERTDIVEVIGRDVTLKRRGRNHLGLCPFHQEKTPSFNVLPDRQIYHCFGCGEGGDVFKFMMKTQGLSFTEAVKELAGVAGVTIQERELTREDRVRIQRRASLHDTCAEACTWFQANLMTRPEGARARAYLEDRGITRETIERTRLGFAPAGWNNLMDHLHRQGIDAATAERAGLARRSDRAGGGRYDVFRDRVIFPILDNRDRPIAFGGRLMEGDGPKYLNSPESDIYDKSSTLYGISWARPMIQRRDRVIVVEGYFDVLSLFQAGFPETVATCGTALTAAHARQLQRLTGTAIALFDGDEAGIRAADRSLPLFLEAGLEARHLELPDAKDPDEFVQHFGADAFEAHLKGSVPLIEMVIRRAVNRHSSTPGGRDQAVKELAPLLRKLQGTLRSHMLIRTADLLQIRDDSLKEMLGHRQNPQIVASPGAVTRWQPPTDLRELLRLLLHFPDEISGALSETDPDIVSHQDDVKWVVGQLLAGVSLTAVLDDLGETDLAWWLQSLAADQGPETSETAASATGRLLARLEHRNLDGSIREMTQEIQDIQKRLPALKHQLTDDEYAAEQEAWRHLIQERSVLQRRASELRSTKSTRR